VLDVGDVLAVTDLFVITSGGNARQVKAIVEEIERKIAEAGGPRPLRVEGLDTLEWVLLDYGPFVVHVFNEEQRAFYRLERLWGDRPRLEWKVEPAND
jgi:ribosome-associated protein